MFSSGNNETEVKSSSSHTLDISACDVIFNCISATDGECVFEIMRSDMIEHRRRGAVNSSEAFSNLMPNTLYFYRIIFTTLQSENGTFTTDDGKKTRCFY